MNTNKPTKKPIKDTKLGQFAAKAFDTLKDSAPIIANGIVSAVTSPNPVGSVIQTVSNLVAEGGNGELIQEFEENRKDFELEMYRLDNEDRQSARANNQALAQNEDKFIARFPMYLATGVVLFTMGIIYALIFVEIPKSNERILDLCLGVLMGSGITAILAHYFGSTKGSQDKQGLFHQLLHKLTPNR